jgi:shikimate kinase
MQSNVNLIGMPGCGKSTLGVLLAKLTCRDFCDVDLLIQKRIGCSLQQYINEHGCREFLAQEANTLLDLDVQNAVIATGGSAPLTEDGARRIKELGKVVFLDLPYPEIERRVTNLSERGIALEKGQTLRDVFEERRPIYLSLADLTVTLTGGDIATDAVALSKLL